MASPATTTAKAGALMTNEPMRAPAALLEVGELVKDDAMLDRMLLGAPVMELRMELGMEVGRPEVPLPVRLVGRLVSEDKTLESGAEELLPPVTDETGDVTEADGLELPPDPERVNEAVLSEKVVVAKLAQRVVRTCWAAATSAGLQLLSTQVPAAWKKAASLQIHLKLVNPPVQLDLEAASVAQVVAQAGGD